MSGNVLSFSEISPRERREVLRIVWAGLVVEVGLGDWRRPGGWTYDSSRDGILLFWDSGVFRCDSVSLRVCVSAHACVC